MYRALFLVVFVSPLSLLPAPPAAFAFPAFAHHCLGASGHTPFELDYSIQSDSQEGSAPRRKITGQLVGLFMDGYLFSFSGRTGMGQTFQERSKTVATVRTTAPAGSGGLHYFTRWHSLGVVDVVQIVQKGLAVQLACDLKA
jgi:hypothetical protein